MSGRPFTSAAIAGPTLASLLEQPVAAEASAAMEGLLLGESLSVGLGFAAYGSAWESSGECSGRRSLLSDALKDVFFHVWKSGK